MASPYNSEIHIVCQHCGHMTPYPKRRNTNIGPFFIISLYYYLDVLINWQYVDARGINITEIHGNVIYHIPSQDKQSGM